MPEPERFSIDEAIQDAAIEHNVDPALIRSIIAAESSFEPDAESTAGAVGYMQIMPETAEELGYDASDKQQNIQAGSKYLSFLIEKYKGARNGLRRAIAAYNAGPATVDRYKGVPPFRETPEIREASVGISRRVCRRPVFKLRRALIRQSHER